MKLGSLFDGSGTAPLAAAICGIEPVWASEIEPYPRAVTKARFPRMQHLGDITKIDGRQIAWVDIICGGSPCQDLSVAGKQAGLQNGERSHLFFEMVRIIREMREASNGKYPKFIIWENVPGAFSSNDGRDFLAVLQSFAEIADPEVHVPEPPHRGRTDRLDWRPAGSIVGDGWSIAWRTVDAQFWGVPQRRRRIYLVMAFCGVSGGDCGDEVISDTGIGRAGEILFERKGMRGHSETCGTSWKGTACDAKDGSGTGDREGETIAFHLLQDVIFSVDYTPCLTAGSKNGEAALGVLYALGFKAGNSEKAHGIGYEEEISPTLSAAPSGTNQVPSIVERIYSLQGNTVDRKAAQNGLGICENIAHTLNATDRHCMAFAVHEFGGYKQSDIANVLRARDYKAATDLVCGVDCRNMNESPEVYPTLLAKPNGGCSLNFSHAVRIYYIVRRLIPVECARLQGFPDWWTEGSKQLPGDSILWNYIDPCCKVEGSDSAKFKMWGNGMALPNMLHVMRGIRRLENGWVQRGYEAIRPDVQGNEKHLRRVRTSPRKDG